MRSSIGEMTKRFFSTAGRIARTNDNNLAAEYLHAILQPHVKNVPPIYVVNYQCAPQSLYNIRQSLARYCGMNPNDSENKPIFSTILGGSTRLSGDVIPGVRAFLEKEVVDGTIWCLDSTVKMKRNALNNAISVNQLVTDIKNTIPADKKLGIVPCFSDTQVLLAKHYPDQLVSLSNVDAILYTNGKLFAKKQDEDKYHHLVGTVFGDSSYLLGVVNTERLDVILQQGVGYLIREKQKQGKSIPSTVLNVMKDVKNQVPDLEDSCHHGMRRVLQEYCVTEGMSYAHLNAMVKPGLAESAIVIGGESQAFYGLTLQIANPNANIKVVGIAPGQQEEAGFVRTIGKNRGRIDAATFFGVLQDAKVAEPNIGFSEVCARLGFKGPRGCLPKNNWKAVEGFFLMGCTGMYQQADFKNMSAYIVAPDGRVLSFKEAAESHLVPTVKNPEVGLVPLSKIDNSELIEEKDTKKKR